MSKETLIHEIQNVLSTDKAVFYRIDQLLKEYQGSGTVGRDQELSVLARIQTELEKLLIYDYHLVNLQLMSKIRTILDKVLQEKHSRLTPVEKNIHFVWIGTIGSVQITYMKAWTYYNPDYAINLWHDPDALLAGVLRKKIKLYAGTLLGIGIGNLGPDSTASTSIRAVIDLQNEFYKGYLLAKNSPNETFDDCVTRFLWDKGWSTLDELEQIKSENKRAFNRAVAELNAAQSVRTPTQPNKPIRLREINTALFQNTAGKDYYKYYLKELGLRQNLASASDKARYMILYKEGGVYLDADLLPHPHGEVWQKIKTELLDNINKKKAINDTYPQDDPIYVKGVSLLELVDVFRSLFSNKLTMFETNIYRRRAYVEIVLMNSLLRACHGDGQPPKPDYQQLALDINRGNSDPFFNAIQPLFPEIDRIIETLPKKMLMDPLGELRILRDGIGYMEHPYVEGRITNSYLLAPKNSAALLKILDLVFQKDTKIEEDQIDRVNVSNPPSPPRRSSNEYSTLDINLMMYRHDGWIDGSVATVYSSGPRIITAWLTDYVTQHPELAAYFEVFKQQFFVFSNISRNTEEDMKSTWIGSAMISRNNYYEKPSIYKSQLIIQFDSDPSTEAAARWLYNKRRENSLWVKIIRNGGRIALHCHIPTNFKFYDNGAEEKARILLIGRGENGQLNGLNGDKIAEGIVKVLASPEVKPYIDARISFTDQSTNVISRISVVASGIESFDTEASDIRSGTSVSLNHGFTYQLLTQLRQAGLVIQGGISIRDAMIGVDTVGRKWTGNWDTLSKKILWHSAQSAYKWIGVLDPADKTVKFTKVVLGKDLLTQIRPWIDINKHGRFGLFSRYAFRDGLIPSKMSDTFNEDDFALFTDKFDHAVGHRVLMADVMALFSGMKKKELPGGKKVRSAIVDERADQLRILRDVLQQVTFNERQDQWLTWLASSRLVEEKTQQKLRQLLTDNPHYYAQLRASADEELFDFYYVDFAQKNAYYPIINHLGTESQNIILIYLGNLGKRLQALMKKIAQPGSLVSTSSLDFFQENILKLSSEQTHLVYSVWKTGQGTVSTAIFQANVIEIAADLPPMIPREKTLLLAGSYLNSAFLFENLTEEIALLGRSVPADSLALLQKITPVNGQNKSKVPFLHPNTGVMTEVETNKNAFRQARDSLEKNYLIPWPDNSLMMFSEKGYSYKKAVDLSSWVFNKIFVAHFLIEQIKAGKGLFAQPETQGLPDGLRQTLVLQHYVGIMGMTNDLVDDAARLSYFTASKVLNRQTVVFSLRKMAYLSSELLASTTTTHRYAVLAKGILEKNQIQYALKKFTTNISKTAMGLGLAFSAIDVALTTEAFLNAPDNDSQMILGTQLGFSVLGFGIQLGAIGLALTGATSMALALGVLALVVAVTGVLVVLLLESFQKEANEVKTCALFLKTLKESRETGYLLKNGCFVHEGTACIRGLELGTDCKIIFGSQRYQAYRSTSSGSSHAKFERLNVLKEFKSSGVALTALPSGNDTGEVLNHNLVLPCIARTDYDFSYTMSGSRTIDDESDATFASLRALARNHEDFVFSHSKIVTGLAQVTYLHREIKAITASRRPTNIRVRINPLFQQQWALHFPWIENKEDYNEEHAIFKTENPDWQTMEYEEFKEKVKVQEQLFREEIINNARKITYHIDNAANTQQILVLPPPDFPLTLWLRGSNWLISALNLGTIAPLRRESDQLQIGRHKIYVALVADQNIRIQYLIHRKATLIQRITVSEMNIVSLVFDAADCPENSIKREIELLYQSQKNAYNDFSGLQHLLIKNYHEGDYHGNAHYLIKNKKLVFAPVLAPFKFATEYAQFLVEEANQAFFYANLDLHAESIAMATSGRINHPFQPTFWITHCGLSRLEFINYSFLPFFSSSTRLQIKTEIVEEQGQLMLIERYKKSNSSVEIQYAININFAANQPLLLRKIQFSQDIFSISRVGEWFSGSSQTTLEQLQALLCTTLLGNHTSISAGKIYADEMVYITNTENTKEYWWSRSCGILTSITLPTGKQEKIKPIWSGRTDYQRASFWTPVGDENAQGLKKLYVKRNTEPHIDYTIDYTKLGLLKHSGHTLERLYVEDAQGNTYALDVSGRAYLSRIGSAWLNTHRNDLPAAFEALFASNSDEVEERFHLPVLSVEGFLCTERGDAAAYDTHPLKTWYDKRLKRFYFYQPVDGQKPDYLSDDAQRKAALWDTRDKALLQVGSMSIGRAQTFNLVIPINRLPPAKRMMSHVQKAWKNEGLLYLQNGKLLFTSDFTQSPHDFSLHGITEEYLAPYLLSYQLTQALKEEFFTLFNSRTYSYHHYSSWQTRLADTSSGVPDLSAINFAKRKAQLRKILIDKIVTKTPQEESIAPRHMWAFLAAYLVNFLPQEQLRTRDLQKMIGEAFTTIQSRVVRISLHQKKCLQFGQYGWYDSQAAVLFIMPREKNERVNCQYLSMSRDGNSLYVSAEEQKVYKLAALQEWTTTHDWPAASQPVVTPLFIKRLGDELIFIEKVSPSSERQEIIPFSADFLSDMPEIKTLYPGRKSATLPIKMQDWSEIHVVIRAKGRGRGESVNLLINKNQLAEYKVQREGSDLWIFRGRRKFALCVTDVLDSDPMPEDITLKVATKVSEVTVTLGQLVEKYNNKPNQLETFYDEVIHPTYLLDDLLTDFI
ncbi:TcdA/TcdB catalytic glycosyltransferase domain-containing protein [Candidatus Fukatsuia symbiotica]|uniref:TcdA/TcdB catalytic glycosyltransferase domain-containing protein n=1 Tax=Candidatus Fukatsuia TaxID=1927833 RepID=UPI000E70EB62|nr:TcdA/TcdB catalytic glycosyltransferase domain-containing protein [Candidatus Fukatsuia symbiotica]MEA9444405.1 TcdA/TcdB catalytic glycosyltransferase domain-containing protein [Candidatus Fukatsuia symbiotica]